MILTSLVKLRYLSNAGGTRVAADQRKNRKKKK